MNHKTQTGTAGGNSRLPGTGKSDEMTDSDVNSSGGCGDVEHELNLGKIPESVRATLTTTPGVYDARRSRSQREIIRDVMLSASECETWLTLGELRALTQYGEASISAQLRHLRKSENGGFDVVKRHREGASPERSGTDGRGERMWEYRISRGVALGSVEEGQLAAIGA